MIVATYRDVPSPNEKKRQGNSETEDDSDGEIEMIQPGIGWAYIGSHNFTPSAWGTLSGSSFNPILNVKLRYYLLVFVMANQDLVQIRSRITKLGLCFPLKTRQMSTELFVGKGRRRSTCLAETNLG